MSATTTPAPAPAGAGSSSSSSGSRSLLAKLAAGTGVAAILAAGTIALWPASET